MIEEFAAVGKMRETMERMIQKANVQLACRFHTGRIEEKG